LNSHTPHLRHLRIAPAPRLGVFGLAMTGLIALTLAGAPALAQQARQPAKAQPKAAPKTAAKASPAAPGGGSGQTFLIGTFGDWKALTTGKDRQKVCYALASPNQRLPASLKRDPGYLFISNRVADGAKSEIAFILGFTGKAGQDGTLTIGSNSFAVIASGESAFLKNPAQEEQIIDQMKRAASLTVKVSSARGNESTDRYSMNGITKALEAVAKECP
jgi:hypothetical protein